MLTRYSKGVGTSLNISNPPLYIYFIDFAATLDSIDRMALCTVMECGGIPETIILLIKAFFSVHYIGIGPFIWERLLRNKK